MHNISFNICHGLSVCIMVNIFNHKIPSNKASKVKSVTVKCQNRPQRKTDSEASKFSQKGSQQCSPNRIIDLKILQTVNRLWCILKWLDCTFSHSLKLNLPLKNSIKKCQNTNSHHHHVKIVKERFNSWYFSVKLNWLDNITLMNAIIIVFSKDF